MLNPENIRTANTRTHSADSSPIAPEKHAHNHHQRLQVTNPWSTPKQRHSTGNLTTSEESHAKPTKGILKRPHTFHRDLERPKPTSHQQFIFKPEDDKGKRKDEMETRTLSPAEELPKMPQQHVEFSERNAVAVFGDTTTDTEGGHEPNSISKNGIHKLQQQKLNPKKKEAPPAAIVTPLIRQPKKESSSKIYDVQQTPPQQVEVSQQNVPPSTSESRREPSPEGSESGSSIRSNSHIFGKWWTGKSTKFVVHCDRRGCSHGHSHERTPEQQQQDSYLTPTQRKQQEVASLKKELRRTQLACREKERHFSQLRERMAEIETMMSSSSNAQMAQCAQLRQKMVEQEEEFVVERDALIARHEHKVRQQMQEIVDLRAELARKEKILADRERIQYKDVATQASDESVETKSNESSVSLAPPNAIAGWNPPDPDRGDDQKEPISTANTTTTINSQSAPVSPCKAPIVQIGAEVLATLEAYRNETVVWRTRCANLELIMQDLLLREGARAAGENAPLGSTLYINVEGNAIDVDETQQPQQPREVTVERKSTEREQSLQPTLRKAECQVPGCVERKRKLVEENEKLMEKANKFELELIEIKRKNNEIEMEMHKLNSEFVHMSKKHAELAALAETRLNEGKALKLTLQAVQSEKEKFEQAIAYLERRCQIMELIGLDQGIVIVEEPLSIDGPLSKEFTVRGSKATQTALTVDALGLNEKTMDELQIRLRVMQSTFAEDKAQMSIELAEIARVLELKTELVTKLTEQLDEAARLSRREDERHQWERDVFMTRIEELGRVAERVPILESEIEKALTDKSRCELRLREVEEQLDDAMEAALDTALDRNRIREEYWNERLDAVDRERKEVKALLEHERRKAADERMKWSLEVAELDRRLTTAIQHIGFLNARINCPKRDAQCEVHPRTSNKYVSCRPNQRDQECGAELRDEEMEELKFQVENLTNARELLLAEMSQLEEEAQEATELIQRERMEKIVKKRTPADFLTVSFHRKSEKIEFGGSSGHLSKPVAGLSTPGDAISIVSLPTVFEHSATETVEKRTFITTKTRSNSLRSGNMTEDEYISELKNNNQIQRNASLPPNQMAFYANMNPAIRSNSAPRRHDIDKSGQYLSPPQMIEQNTVKLEVPKIQITSAEEVRERVHSLRIRMKQFIATGVTNEIACSAGDEELFDQLDAWLRSMAEHEKRSWETQQSVDKLKCERNGLRERLKDAEMELWIYRTEPRRAAVERLQSGWRSCSAEQLGHNGPPLSAKQLRRWKEIAGTCFREVNQLRHRLANAEEERLALRNKVAILKGELAMSKCQQLHSKLTRRRKNSFDKYEIDGETLASYNRWLGGDRWQSVPDLDETDQFTGPIKSRKIADANKEKAIVDEALRKQYMQLRNERDNLVQMERGTADQLTKKQTELEEVQHRIKKVEAECELLRRENNMYEEKCVEMDKDRQQMYLVMFRKGQQAANQAMVEELDKTAELQVVLRFLHDAFFYYLLNKGNAREHLQAIMTMLNFTAEQKEEVYRRKGKSH